MSRSCVGDCGILWDFMMRWSNHVALTLSWHRVLALEDAYGSVPCVQVFPCKRYCKIIIQCEPSLSGLNVVIQAKGFLRLSRRLGHQIEVFASHLERIVGYTQ